MRAKGSRRGSRRDEAFMMADWIRLVWERFSSFLGRKRATFEQDEEFRFHLAMETESNLRKGMSPAAALAFLIAGPTTTIPAMAAVWGLATRPVFVLYASFSLVGAIVLGVVYSLVMMF